MEKLLANKEHMADTVKRISVGLSKEDLRSLTALSEAFGETPSQVVKRGLAILTYITFHAKADLEEVE